MFTGSQLTDLITASNIVFEGQLLCKWLRHHQLWKDTNYCLRRTDRFRPMSQLLIHWSWFLRFMSGLVNLAFRTMEGVSCCWLLILYLNNKLAKTVVGPGFFASIYIYISLRGDNFLLRPFMKQAVVKIKKHEWKVELARTGCEKRFTPHPLSSRWSLTDQFTQK